MSEIIYPEKPQEPLQSDCCGNGCTPCVFDLYERDLKQWQKECQDIKHGTKDSTWSQVDVLTTYHKFEIESITKEAKDTWIYRFRIPDNGCLKLGVGQHLILRGNVDKQKITRQYTPISDTCGHFDVMIKLYRNGQMSQYIKNWQVGDMVEWRGPFGTYTYQSNKFENLVLLAAGSGLAPMVQVIQSVLDNEEDETCLQLVFSCKTYEEILLKEKLDEWSHYWNFSVLYVLTQENEDNVKKKKKYGDKIHFGRITPELLSPFLAKPKLQVLTCGTRSFDKDMIKFAKSLDIEEEYIFKF